MKAMLAAFVASAVIAAAPIVLRELGYTVETTRAGDNVRLGTTPE